MKKQIVAISILVLFLMLSNGAVNVSAGGGTCSIPSCRPRAQAVSPAPNDVTQASAQDPADQQTVPTTQAENSFSLILLTVWWAMSVPYFM
jgi:hypothetical protein